MKHIYLLFIAALLSVSAMAQTSADAFITTWNVTGTTATDLSITIPTTGVGYNYAVNWGDGNSENSLNGNATHQYATAGTYTVSITGIFPRIDFSNSTQENRSKITSIDQWGTQQWTSMNAAFRGCNNLQITAIDVPNLSIVTDMSSMFREASFINAEIGGWNVSNVTNMNNMFSFAGSFNGDISGWNVGNVTNMNNMFFGATNFNQDISSWNVGSLTNMDGMFSRTSFNQNIGGWNVGNVTNMNNTFFAAPNFNQDISGWDVSKVTTMDLMFYQAFDFDQDLGGWNIASITNMRRMFEASGVSVTNYSNTLNGWAQLSILNTGVTLGSQFFGQVVQYCDDTGRNILINNFGWEIYDGGRNCSQTITFNPITNKTFGDDNFNLSATSNRGLTISFTSSNENVATVSGNEVTITGAGTTNITASQSGDGSFFDAAPNVVRSLIVEKADQTITFNALDNKKFEDENFTLSASSNSGLEITYTSSNTEVVTITGNEVSILGAGSTSITASQVGNDNYNAATDVLQDLTVEKANQTITFEALPNVTVGDPDFTLTASTNSVLEITYTSSNTDVATITGDVVSIIGVGTTNITASQAGNENYNAATDVTQQLSVLVPSTHLNFDGINDGVDLGNSLTADFAGKNTVTLEAWVKPETTNALGVIVGNFSYPTNTDTMQMLLRRDNTTYTFWIDSGSGYTNVSTPVNTVAVNTWQHVAGTWDGITMKIYVDGVLQNQFLNNGTGFPSSSNAFVLGYNEVQSINEKFDGSIDEVRIWDVARSELQINVSKDCELNGTEAGLQAYYQFNQGLGSGDNTAIITLTDATANAYDGILFDFNLNGTESNWLSGSPIETDSTIPEAPSAEAQSFCGAATVANLIPAPSSIIQWYALETDESVLNEEIELVTGTYYVTLANANGCESERTPVNITINEVPAAPIVDAQSFCGDALVADLLPALSTTILWYDVETEGEVLSENTGLSTGTYYVSQVSAEGCESERTSVNITINEVPEAPTAEAQSFCGDALVADLLPALSITILWYDVETEGEVLSENTELSTGTYYVSQVSAEGCESERTPVNITINEVPEVPTVESPVTYNEGDTALPLAAISGGSGLLWYTTETDGQGVTDAPTPSTAQVGSTSYWVSSTTNEGCESDRAEIIVNVEEFLSTRGNEIQNKISIYPNPTNGLVNITNTSQTELQVAVYDIRGRLLLSSIAHHSDHTLDLSKFTDGVYLVRLTSDLGQITKRIIKN